jgi:hypothetical protein
MELGNKWFLNWAKNSDGTWKSEFSEWFKGSVLKDKSDTPLIFYHGTKDGSPDQDIPTWSFFNTKYMRELGFHFGSANAANQILRMPKEGGLGYGKDHRIFVVVISMKNPLRVPDVEDFDSNSGSIQTELKDALVRGVCGRLSGGRGPSPCEREVLRRLNAHVDRTGYFEDLDQESQESFLNGEMWNPFLPISAEGFKQAIESFGYDGLIYVNKFDKPAGVVSKIDSVAAFFPHQIRSAITGEFLWNDSMSET